MGTMIILQRVGMKIWCYNCFEVWYYNNIITFGLVFDRKRCWVKEVKNDIILLKKG
jgi:hypothetical protein